MNWFWMLLVAVIAYHLGYSVAHFVVAKECERLGGFFVGEKVYKCTRIENAADSKRVEDE